MNIEQCVLSYLASPAAVMTDEDLQTKSTSQFYELETIWL